MSLRFGLLYEMEVRGRDAEAERQMFEDVLAQIVLGDQLGYESAWIAEHHFCRGFSHAAAPDLMLAAAARLTSRIRLGLGVVLLPFNHPARTAERVATLDQLSRGRVEFGTGRGASPLEYQTFNVPYEESRRLWDESLDAVLEIWRADTNPLTIEHPDWILPDCSVFPRPYQRPHPPVWAASISTEGIVAAGEKGCNLLCLSLLKGLDAVAEDIASYKDALARHGYDPDAHRVAMLVPWHLAPTRDEAIERAVTQYLWYLRRLVNIVFSPHWLAARDGLHRMIGHLAATLPQDECLDVIHRERMMVLDDAEGSLAAIKDFEAAGITDLLCQFRVGGLDHELVVDSMQRFADIAFTVDIEAQREIHVA